MIDAFIHYELCVWSKVYHPEWPLLLAGNGMLGAIMLAPESIQMSSAHQAVLKGVNPTSHQQLILWEPHSLNKKVCSNLYTQMFLITLMQGGPPKRC